MNEFDLIVIGSGPGGYVAAIRAAQYGLKTAVVERRDVGGTCLNRGCIPTKALLHASSLYRASQKEFAEIGLSGQNSLDWAQLHARKLAVVEKLRGGTEALLKGNKVEIVRGTGTLEKDGSVHVCLNEGGDCTLRAKNVLLASGSEPDIPTTPGFDLPGVISSDDILEGVPAEVRRIAILGGGVIGCEFAAFYNDIGAEVELIVTSPRILRKMDKDLAMQLNSVFKRSGIKITLNTSVNAITKEADGLHLKLDTKGREGETVADTVLVAKGRKPYLEGLLGEGVEVEMNRKFVKVNENFETSLPGVYAIGDLIGGMQLAHEAEAEGQAAVAHIAGKPVETRPDIIPSCIYTQPEIASVGLCEEEAKEQGIEVKVGKYLMAGNSKAIIEGMDRGFIKLVFAASDEKLLGVHMICGRASDLISEFAMAIANGLTRADLLRGMRPHPTYCEGISEAVEAVEGMSIHTMPSRLRG